MKKSLFTGIILTLVLVALAGCRERESAIVGRWIDDVGDEITFFSDGSFTSTMDPREGTYSISGSQITISGDGVAITVEYEINGNELLMTFRGVPFVLKKEE